MKAVILVGGQGTRLRPLTVNMPKPLIPVVNRPFLDHILYLLRTHGITDVLLAMSYLSENFEQEYGDGSHLGMRLQYVHEVEPLGTAGAIKNVQGYLTPGETFLAFNGDVLTDLDLTDMLRFHKENGSSCTISLTHVDDPSQYGVIDLSEKGRITRFTEKPKRDEATSNWINAGTYIMEPEVLDQVPEGKFYMVERGLFPHLLQMGRPLYGYRTGAYWLDIGTPSKYLQAHIDVLDNRLKDSIQPEGALSEDRVWVGEGTTIDSGARLKGPVVIGRNCVIAANAAVTGPAVLGDNCHVGEDAYIQGIVAWNGAVFGEKSECVNSIIGAGAQVSAGSQVSAYAIVGDGANTGKGNQLAAGARLWPGITLPDRALTF